MFELISGTTNGQRWIAGTIPMKQNISFHVDTRTGVGVAEIMKYLEDFISYQAAHITLTSFTNEDIIQELNIIALTAIPDYDASKYANMLTFLQNHIRNRIVNLYKYSTEQCRTAIHDNYRLYRVKCPGCNRNNIINKYLDVIVNCNYCGNPKTSDDNWKFYPLQIITASANEELTLQDGSQTTIQEYCSNDDTYILFGKKEMGDEALLLKRLSIIDIITTLDDLTKQIVIAFMEGNSVLEISKQLNLTTVFIRSKIEELATNKVFIEINQ